MTYNNETGLHEFDEWTREAQWFVDQERNLYIVPPPELVTEMYEAPDNPISHALDALCRAGQQPISEEAATSLGLTPVPPVLYRFNEHDGYYVA